MKPAPYRISKPVVFVCLMLISLLLLISPRRFTQPIAALLQPFGWLQSALASMTRARVLTPPTAEHEQLQARIVELQRQIGVQSLRLAELELRVDELSRIRAALHDDTLEILPAWVIAGDASPQRDTLEIARGSLAGVQAGQWVVSARPLSDADAGLTGADLLARQWLIGRISAVQPYLSRVQLATDAGFGPQRVRAAQIGRDGGWRIAESEALLYGRGGTMAIVESKADFLAGGYAVVLVPASAELPAPLPLGRIVGTQRLSSAPLHYNLEVERWDDPRRLSLVYVLVRRE